MKISYAFHLSCYFKNLLIFWPTYCVPLLGRGLPLNPPLLYVFGEFPLLLFKYMKIVPPTPSRLVPGSPSVLGHPRSGDVYLLPGLHSANVSRAIPFKLGHFYLHIGIAILRTWSLRLKHKIRSILSFTIHCPLTCVYKVNGRIQCIGFLQYKYYLKGFMAPGKSTSIDFANW